MWFTLDFWWKREVDQLQSRAILIDRLYFLAVGSVSAGGSVIATGIILNAKEANTLDLLIVNWLALLAIAILKFIVLSNRYMKAMIR
jgi:hypothetical protein